MARNLAHLLQRSKSYRTSPTSLALAIESRLRGAIEPAELVSRVRAWLTHAHHGQTRRMCEHELARPAFRARDRC
jgi:hypothetical protein